MIRFFKLLGGDEIVADVDKSEGWSEQTVMRRPYRNTVIQTPQGLQPMLIPYPCGEIVVQNVHVLFSGDPNDDLANAYRSLTGGVVMPNRTIQTPDQFRGQQ